MLKPPTHGLEQTHAALLARVWDVRFRDLAARRDRLRRLGEAVGTRRTQLTRALELDLGKHPAEAEIVEVQPVRGEIARALRDLARWARPRRVRTPMTLLGARGEVRPEPKGAVLILAPWNYPVNLALTPLVSAIAAGNTVALKPSEKAPHAAQAMRELIEATFAPDEVAVFTGGPEVARGLLDLPWDHVFFTGSTAVGREVMAAASRHLSPVTLELGGKSPAIVDGSADLALSARRVAWGKFLNAGQTCVAPDYLLVQESAQRELIAQLGRAVREFYGGEAWQAHNRDYGRLADQGAARRVGDLIADALAGGARLEFGGAVEPERRFVAPTVLSGVTPGMRVMREEIFAPVLPIVTYRDPGEAVALVRALGKPLALYVFSRDEAFVDRVARETASGGLVVNGVVVHLIHDRLPFGGVGPSGMGSYHGEYGFRTFSYERAVLREGRASPVRLTYPPYGRPAPRLVAWLMRQLS